MDLIKIGKYISSKRKEKNMTQKELALKLGMSDKSVSKWERGICLPDVSLYAELCEHLGISINEFLAGEDISFENIPDKSEENIITVSKDNKMKQIRLKKIIAFAVFVAFISLFLVGYMFYTDHKNDNKIIPLKVDDSKTQAINLLIGSGSAHIFDYNVSNCEIVSLNYSIYHNGVLDDTSSLRLKLDRNGSKSTDGEIVIASDLMNHTIKVANFSEGVTIKTEISAIEEVKDKERYGLTTFAMDDPVNIDFNKTIPLLVLVYDKDVVRSVDLNKPIENQDEVLKSFEFAYVFEIEFMN